MKPLQHAREVRAGERRPVWRGTALGGGASAVTALTISPNFANDHTLFVASNAGVFVSRDRGDSYERWSAGLTPPGLIALAISPNYAEDRLVYALGPGGTLWRRPDEGHFAGDPLRK
ncbi:MAG: hypothetical protein LC797_19545 [Chloroflexi bacterium]|nr:hypothetical protein [Chloroflexota bacterium]